MMVNVGIKSEKGMISSTKLTIPASMPFLPGYILDMINADTGAQTKSINGMNPIKSRKILSSKSLYFFCILQDINDGK